MPAKLQSITIGLLATLGGLGTESEAGGEADSQREAEEHVLHSSNLQSPRRLSPWSAARHARRPPNHDHALCEASTESAIEAGRGRGLLEQAEKRQDDEEMGEVPDRQQQPEPGHVEQDRTAKGKDRLVRRLRTDIAEQHRNSHEDQKNTLKVGR